jgi:F-type H+-transporting ATPase subunit b
MLENPETWVALAFVVFVALTFKPIKKAMTAGLDGRIEAIRREIEEAQELRDEAQHLLAEHRRKLREAMDDARAVIGHAKEEAERLREKAEADLEASMKRRQQAAEEKIAQAEARAVKEVRDQAIEIAIAATAKLMAEKVDAGRAAELVDQSIRELPSRLH